MRSRIRLIRSRIRKSDWNRRTCRRYRARRRIVRHSPLRCDLPDGKRGSRQARQARRRDPDRLLPAQSRVRGRCWTRQSLRSMKLPWSCETRCTQVRVRVRWGLHRITPIVERPRLELERPVLLVGEAEGGVEARASGRVTMMIDKLGFVDLVDRR